MLKKDLLELCLLQLLAGEDRYGYQLLSSVHTAFPHTQESAVYALLRSLCREGYTQRYQGETSGGPARKYYRLTEAGRDRHRALLETWRTLCGALEALGVR